MKTTVLPTKTLNWLLESNNPPIRNATKEILLKEPPSTKEILETNEYPPIQQIISLINPNGSWGNPKTPYKKYTGDYWQFIFLCDLNANPNELIHKVCSHIISYQLASGGFTHKIGSNFPLICLTANIIRSLTHFGINNESTLKGIKFLTDHIIEKQGVFCSPDPLYTLLPDCQMAITKILAMYATLGTEILDSYMKKAVKIIVDKIIENKIFRYVPIGAKEYQKSIRGKKSKEIRKIREEFVLQPEKLKKGDIKKSWLKYGFPQSYTSDVLETLFWLAKYNIPYHKEFEEAIDHLIDSMTPSGLWINQIAFRNPFLVKIEPKKASSKWLTFRACFVLNHFFDLQFEG